MPKSLTIRRHILILSGGIMSTAPALSQAPQRTPALQSLTLCRGVPVPAERLACFDKATALLDEAERKGDLIVADRDEIRRDRRTLFGLKLPDLSLFNRRKGVAEPELDQIETTLRSARQVGYKWEFVLADGARWLQNDTRTLVNPKPGGKVVIRRAAMGSYFLKVGQEPAVRAIRLD